jgi:hypothetical protein
MKEVCLTVQCAVFFGLARQASLSFEHTPPYGISDRCTVMKSSA